LRLYLDENVHSRGVVDGLRLRGFDCLTVNEAGMRGQSDDVHLSFAAGGGRALYTNDVKDFYRIGREWRIAGRHSGLILLTSQESPVGEQIACFVRLVERLEGAPMTEG